MCNKYISSDHVPMSISCDFGDLDYSEVKAKYNHEYGRKMFVDWASATPDNIKDYRPII